MAINENDILSDFGNKIRKLRKDRGLSMQGLANIAEIELSQVYRIETAKINPKLTTLYKLSAALDVNISELISK